jgi:hypothetical protein
MAERDEINHRSSVREISDAEIRDIETQASELLERRLLDDSDTRSLYRAMFERLLFSGYPERDRNIETIQSLQTLLPNQEIVSIISPILAQRGSAIYQLSRFTEENIRKKDLVGKVFDQLPRALLYAWVDAEFDKAIERHGLTSSGNLDKQLNTCLMFIRRVDLKMTEGTGDMRLSDLAYQKFASNRILFKPKGDSTTSGPEMMAQMLLHRIPHDDSIKGVPPERVRDFIRAYKPKQGALGFNLVMTDLLLRMRKKGVPNHGIAQIIVEYTYATRGLEGVLRLLDKIQKTERRVLSGTAFLDRLVLGLIQPRSTAPYTSDIIRLARLIMVLKYQSPEPSDEVLQEYLSKIRFRHFLDRARDAHVLPLSYQTMPMKEMWSQRVDVIHQLAHQYSIDNTRSHNQNVRSIVYLYRYLKTNDLPIGPLFTKALVRTCLTQPMLQNRFISSRRLIWVCNIVAQVEGVDVAKRIENVFWDWRGDLIAHAKKRLDTLAGPSLNKAHVNTMKRLGVI